MERFQAICREIEEAAKAYEYSKRVGDIVNKMKLAEHPGETSEEQQYDKPTYLKAHVKHMDTETLEAFNLPWEWDDVSDFSKWEPSIYHLCDVDSADLSTTHSEILVTLS